METIKQMQNSLIFVKLAESGSFSGAGKALGISKSQVSKALKALEEDLGVTLLNRNTRQIHLTERGRQYLSHCQQAVNLLESGKTELLATAREPRGNLRVTMAGVFSEKFIAPCLIQMAKKYPHLNVQAHFDSRVVNILENNFDVAIRIGNLPDSSLRSKKIGTREEVILSSPQYLKNVSIETPSDLKKANCIGVEAEWTLRRSGKNIKLDVKGNFRSNNPRVMVEALLKGLGVAKLPIAYVEQELKKGKLVSILEEYREPAKDIWFITPHKIKHNHNVELFYEELMQFLEKNGQGEIF